MPKKSKASKASDVTCADDFGMFLAEAQNDLIILEDGIDKTVREHPAKFYSVSSRHAMAAAIRDTAKNDLVEARSGAYIRLRTSEEDAGKKRTEAHLNALVETDDEVLEKTRLLALRSLEASQVGTLKDAYIQRSFAIRDLASLTVHNYLASSTISAGPSNAEYDKNKESIAKHRKSSKKELKKRG